jgi:CHAD domain-containing protein
MGRPPPSHNLSKAALESELRLRLFRVLQIKLANMFEKSSRRQSAARLESDNAQHDSGRKHRMAYRLKAGRLLAKSILRVGHEQIERSTSELGQNPNPHDGVHQARKAFKRLRALLLLIRPIIGETAYACETQRYRGLGQRFSGARDVQALIDTVHKLEASAPFAEKRRAVDAILEHLHGERIRAEEALAQEHTGSGLKALSEAQEAFASLTVQDATMDGVVCGLEAGYRRGRQCFFKAYDKGDDEHFHDWRKAMQRHWRHLQLVSPAWPEALQPRIVLAQELSQLLGDEHDLSVLRQRVAVQCGSLLVDDEMAEFLKLCRKQQEELRRLAKGRGARLFGEKPKAFRLRIANYWRTASEIEPLGEGVADADLGGDGSGHKTNKVRVIPLRKH